MKLLLTSGGFTNTSIAKSLEKLAGKPITELSLVFIPTAANIEDDDKQWLIDDLYRCKELGFKYIDIVDIAALTKEDWKPRLEKTDVILVGGGTNSYLFEQMKKSGFDEVLPTLLNTKVYVGISAGSMVVGPYIPDEISEKFFNETLGGTLSFVDFFIKPHLNSPYFPKRTIDDLTSIFADTPHAVYALDDQSAVVIDGDSLEVVSEGQWHKFEPK